jgi:hypothetical protein
MDITYNGFPPTKTTANLTDTEIDDLISNATHYLSISGMFEIKDKFIYETFDNINEDLNTWK